MHSNYCLLCLGALILFFFYSCPGIAECQEDIYPVVQESDVSSLKTNSFTNFYQAYKFQIWTICAVVLVACGVGFYGHFSSPTSPVLPSSKSILEC